jgi:hypothetical protein
MNRYRYIAKYILLISIYLISKFGDISPSLPSSERSKKKVLTTIILPNAIYESKKECTLVNINIVGNTSLKIRDLYLVVKEFYCNNCYHKHGIFLIFYVKINFTATSNIYQSYIGIDWIYPTQVQLLECVKWFKIKCEHLYWSLVWILGLAFWILFRETPRAVPNL